MSVIIMFLVWWILGQLAAPTWCFVLFGVAAFLKCIDSFSEAVKSAVEYNEKWKK